MEWVEGQPLNRFVEESLEKPFLLGQLLDIWPKLAVRLRDADIAHADLQHGNVLVVPAADRRLALKLIDYDGMYVPGLANMPSGELGHPNYQHPERLRCGTYDANIDRFSHLAIYCALHCVCAEGPDLWQRFNNDENLLFSEQDYQHPEKSKVFQSLWEVGGANARGRTDPSAEEPDPARLAKRRWLLRTAVISAPLLVFALVLLGALLLRAPPPAVYSVEVEPPEAVLEVSDNKAATVTHEGQEWTVTVNEPDGKKRITLAATKPGYEPLRQDLQPMAGEVRTLPPLRLKASPAVYSVEVEPPAAVLEVSDSKAASLAHEGPKWTVTVNKPDGKTAITLVATLPRYKPLFQELQPMPSDARTLPLLRLKPSPAVYSVEVDPPEAVLEVNDSKAASVTHVGRKWTVRVNEPDGKRRIALTATMPRYKTLHQDLLPLPGDIRNLPLIRLRPWPHSITNSMGMQFVRIEAGEFMMGSPQGEDGGDSDERPQHRVRITHAFYLGTYKVTQAQFKRIMGENPSYFKASGDDAPVETVSWDDAQGFCRKLSDLPEEKAVRRTYRLPTEAQWEYACRAGSTTPYCFGNDEAKLRDYAWYDKNSGKKTHSVGQKNCNAWGLYDMHGNACMPN